MFNSDKSKEKGGKFEETKKLRGYEIEVKYVHYLQDLEEEYEKIKMMSDSEFASSQYARYEHLLSIRASQFYRIKFNGDMEYTIIPCKSATH